MSAAYNRIIEEKEKQEHLLSWYEWRLREGDDAQHRIDEYKKKIERCENELKMLKSPENV